jgi:ubiquinone/menaquinone biosynthesis C-methylase UbiE
MRSIAETGKRLVRRTAVRSFPALKKWAARRHSNRLAERTAFLFMPFMNFGYVPFDQAEKEQMLGLPPQEDISYQLSMQLYYHVAGKVPLQDRLVLDIGCGRGGGSYLIKEYLKARTVVGADLSEGNIERCRAAFVTEGLSFRQADAEKLPFESNSFDAVVNVESSHNYPHIGRFLREVHRVLRDDGFFLYADFRSPHAMDQLKEEMKGQGLDIVQSKDITENVLASLRLRSPAREALLRSNVKDDREYLALSERMRLVGSRTLGLFDQREEIYMSCVARKSRLAGQ